MSIFIDQKYVSLVSVKLDMFKNKKNFLWNFKCPICKDSKKNKTKARGYIYRKKSNLLFLCHNCSYSCSFGNFLKIVDNSLFQEYQLERYKNESSSNIPKPDFSIARGLPVFSNKSNKINLPTIESLDDKHTAKKYVVSRKIPLAFWTDIYYADDFKSFIKEIFPEQDSTKFMDNDCRIILPFYDMDHNLIGVQGRSIGQSKLRYITVKKNEKSRKIFGIDRLDLDERVYVLEGPIDSLFLKNSIATMDANLSSITDMLTTSNVVLVFDNEKRNSEILKNMEKAIKKNLSVCIWPKSIEQKDVNDMILSGHTAEHVQYIIDANTFSGVKAQLQLNMWRKV